MWFIQVSGRVTGPFSEEQLKQMRKRGQFSKLYRVSRTGADWQPASVLLASWGTESATTPRPPVGETRPDYEVPPPLPVTSQFDAPPVESTVTPVEPEQSESKWYYVDASGQSQGPVPDSTIVSLGYQGVIRRSTPLVRVGRSDWTPAGDIPNFSSIFQGKGRSQKAGMGLALAIVAVLAIAVGSYAFRGQLKNVWARSDDAESDGEEETADDDSGGTSDSESELLITSDDQQDRIVKAVAYVMATFYRVDVNGQRTRKMQFGSGTAFAVTEDGYLLTNEHVAKMGHDDYVKKTLAEMLLAGAAESQNKAASLTGAERERELRDATALANVSAVYKKDETKVNAALTVFIDQVPFPARIVHVSSRYDMAVLKITRKPSAYFSLLDGNQPRQGLEVAAIGFPGYVNRGYEKDVAVEEAASASGEDPERTVPPNHLVYSQTSGEVSRVVQDAVQTWHIEHSAQISSGNSGGPLVNNKGVVVGLNFAGIMDVKTVSKANLALGMAQLRKEIEAHIVADIKWVKGK